MALPKTTRINTFALTAYSSSVATTPVAAYAYIPVRGTIKLFAGTLHGAITSADATVTVAVNGTSIGTITLPHTSSAAGTSATGTPTAVAKSRVLPGDVVSFTPSGASGSSIAGDFQLLIETA